MEKPIILVDLEGTLTDCSHRIHHLEAKDYGWWNDGLPNDPPNKQMCKFIEGMQAFADIYIVTAKPELYAGMALQWVKDHTNIEVAQWFFRPDGDSISSVGLKEGYASLFLAEGKHVIMAIDDRKDICDMYEHMGITSMQAGCSGNCAIETPQGEPREVGQILKDGADFFVERAKEYGTAYQRHGRIMAAMFPDGLTLRTSDDFFFFHLLDLDIVKSNRIASTMMRGDQHPDSWHDKMVMSAMATERLEAK